MLFRTHSHYDSYSRQRRPPLCSLFSCMKTFEKFSYHYWLWNYIIQQLSTKKIVIIIYVWNRMFLVYFGFFPLIFREFDIFVKRIRSWFIRSRKRNEKSKRREKNRGKAIRKGFWKTTFRLSEALTGVRSKNNVEKTTRALREKIYNKPISAVVEEEPFCRRTKPAHYSRLW